MASIAWTPLRDIGIWPSLVARAAAIGCEHLTSTEIRIHAGVVWIHGVDTHDGAPLARAIAIMEQQSLLTREEREARLALFLLSQP